MSSLRGRLVAISISDGPDRARLGFPQREIDRALLSLCTALVRAGARVAYGGNLDPNGYTFKIFRHLAAAYAGSREAPFHHFVPDPVLRQTRYGDFVAALREGSGTVKTEVWRSGEFVPARAGGGGIRLGDEVVSNDTEWAAWLSRQSLRDLAEAYTAARRSVTVRVDARVMLGGKMGVIADRRDAYLGSMPGVAEEAILALEANKALVALGAYGGATRDIAIALGLLSPDARVPRSEQRAGYGLAIARIEDLRDRIPHRMHKCLSDLAASDQTERTAYQVVSLLNDWIGDRGTRPA